MEIIGLYFKNILEGYTTVQIALVVVVFILLLIQLYYYMIVYARIPSFRNNPKSNNTEKPDISIIVVLKNDFYYLENTLPKLLSQEYDRFEVVVVSVGSNEDFASDLSMICARHSNLTTTKFEQDPRFPISNKMAINVGIKAARYEHILITTRDAEPASDKWLKFMARGFEGKDVVIGYCGLEGENGPAKGMHRCGRLMMSVRYLAWAIKHDPYRGIIQNIGFTKKIYFEHKGFNHLNMNIGEDDLFIQSIATRSNTGIVMNPNAAMRQKVWDNGGTSWRQLLHFYSYTYKFYPVRIKNYIEWELGSRMLFFLSVLAGLLFLPLAAKVVVGAMLLIRLLVAMFEMKRICKRLGEKKLMWSVLLYDMIAPVSEFSLYLGRTLRHVGGVWR